LKTIAIDAGHNTPHDLGFIYDDELFEFWENRIVAAYAGRYLQQWGYKVEDFQGHLVRDKIPLINSRNAELSIEIHHNANKSEKIRGAEVIYHPNSKQGKKAAKCVLDALKFEGFTTRGIFEGYYRYDKSKGFFAWTAKLWKPSIIVECAYFTNPIDRQVLRYENYHKDIGFAIAKGAMKYVKA